MGRLWRSTIWAKGAIDPADPAEWKYRSQKRAWLPLYDVIAIGAGVWATLFGSPILHRLFPEDTIDAAGMLLALAATVCLMGVIFPALCASELVGKTVVTFLLGSYAASVLLFRTNPHDPESGFVVFILAMAIIPPFMRLSVLGEEWKERRAERATDG